MAEVYLIAHPVNPDEVEKWLGTVWGVCVYSRNVIMDKLARVKDWVGGEIGIYNNLVKQAIDRAHKDLAEMALSLGANAVVNVKLELTPASLDINQGTMICAVAYGTAVKLKLS